MTRSLEGSDDEYQYQPDVDSEEISGDEVIFKQMYMSAVHEKKKKKGKQPIQNRKKRTLDYLSDELEESELGIKEAKGSVQAAAAHTRTAIDLKVIDTLQYFAGPQYEPFSTSPEGYDPGGQRTTAILGPGALLSVGSDAMGATSLPALTQIVTVFPMKIYGWKAGHLLNAMFGGQAVPANLTALTTSANNSMNTFDNAVKNAVGALHGAYVGLAKLRIKKTLTLTYGIQVVIEADESTWDDHNHPGNLVTTGVTCTAEVVDAPDVEELINEEYSQGDGMPTRWESYRDEVLGQMQQVAAFVQTATAAGRVDNLQVG
jgi:hypothetical protein